MANRSVSFLCLLRQVSSALSHNRGSQAPPDLDKAYLRSLISWQGNCMDWVAGRALSAIYALG